MQNDAQTEQNTDQPFDIFIIGGGINGCGIARDAAGRGLRVGLAEMNDLASATSSSSTKLFHGGLRYLEFFEFKLVRKALIERDLLLSAMPHISWPMRFVLPFDKNMRFEADTPTSKLLSTIMPWMKGRRPAWLIRMGLFLYDRLSTSKSLPSTTSINLQTAPEGAPLQSRFLKAFEYSDGWVQDSRLVVLNARDAEIRGATIMPRHKVLSAERVNGLWSITLENTATLIKTDILSRSLVNAGGPWVEDIIRTKTAVIPKAGIRLVKGSHIVTKKLYDHDKCYFFQGTDGRIMFTIPYEDDYTLIGTTEASHVDPDTKPECSQEEIDYMLRFVSEYLETPVTADDVVWAYSGVRPLYDDGASSATAATREYVLTLDSTDTVPLLNVFGGKITTYRKLAEGAMDKLSPFFNDLPDPWTAGVALPGGDFPIDGFEDLLVRLNGLFPFLEEAILRRMARTYGTDVIEMLGDATSLTDLGKDFGAGIFAKELDWVISNEWVQAAEDYLWRRTKLGLRVNAEQVQSISDYISKGIKQ